MSLDKKAVLKVASLARIKMTKEDMEQAREKLNTIVGFIEQLSEVDTDNIEPLPSPVDIPLRLRKDEVSDGGYPEDVLVNAPEELENFYVVPKVIE